MSKMLQVILFQLTDQYACLSSVYNVNVKQYPIYKYILTMYGITQRGRLHLWTDIRVY